MENFKTPHGFNIYINAGFFQHFAADICKYDEEEQSLRLEKAWRKTEYLFETPRCFSFYLLTFFLLAHSDLSFFQSFLSFLAVRVIGLIVSRTNLPKPLYSLLCIIDTPFQLISFNFFLPYILISVLAFITHQWWFLLSYIVAYLVFYIFDSFFAMRVYATSQKNLNETFYGADFCAFIAFYNELQAYKICRYPEFIKMYCQLFGYDSEKNI